MNFKLAGRKSSRLLTVGAAFVTVSILLLFQHQLARSGENYGIRSYDGGRARAAFYDAIEGSECKITKAIEYECFFEHSTTLEYYPLESYPTITFIKESKGWDLLNYGSPKTVKVILIFSNGTTKRRLLPSKLYLYDVGFSVGLSAVTESIKVYLKPVRNELKNLTKLEFRYGSTEFLWLNDRALTSRALDFVEN